MRKQISQKANPSIDLNQYFAKFINWDSLTMYRRKNTCDLLLRTTFLHYHATCWKSIILRQDFFFFNLYFLLFSISLFIRMYLNHLPLYQPWIFWNFDCSLQWIWSNLIRNVWTFLHLDIKPPFFFYFLFFSTEGFLSRLPNEVGEFVFLGSLGTRLSRCHWEQCRHYWYSTSVATRKGQGPPELTPWDSLQTGFLWGTLRIRLAKKR